MNSAEPERNIMIKSLHCSDLVSLRKNDIKAHKWKFCPSPKHRVGPTISSFKNEVIGIFLFFTWSTFSKKIILIQETELWAHLLQAANQFHLLPFSVDRETGTESDQEPGWNPVSSADEALCVGAVIVAVMKRSFPDD